jgi:collagenase-like PrtC family protease
MRWVPPVEMSQATLTALTRELPQPPECEIFAYGRTPLAFSARCFTARRYNLQKDGCDFRCLDHPDGLLLKTRDGQPFLTLNGIQTQSAAACNLLPHLPQLEKAGVGILRLSPQSRHSIEVIALFREAIEHAGRRNEVSRSLQALMPDGACDGFWRGRPGMEASGAST